MRDQVRQTERRAASPIGPAADAALCAALAGVVDHPSFELGAAAEPDSGGGAVEAPHGAGGAAVVAAILAAVVAAVVASVVAFVVTVIVATVAVAIAITAAAGTFQNKVQENS